MEVLASLRRIRTRIYGMERGLRALRSEVETALVALGDDDAVESQRIGCGLSDLLASARDIPLQPVTPYAEFAPGIWGSYVQGASGTELLVATRTLKPMDPRAGTPYVSRLVVHPVFTTTDQPKWCTLEFNVDLAAVKEAKALRLDFGCFYEVAPGATTPLPSTTKLTLRVLTGGGSTRDVVERFVPVTTMSFDHVIEIGPEAVSDFDLSDAKGLVCLISLPQAGAYSFTVERFSVHALND